MTHLAAAVPMADPPRTGAREIGLWTAAAILIVGAHVAIAYAVQNFSLANEMDGGPPPAVAIELSPMMVAPAVPEDTMADVVTPEPTNQVEETVADARPVVEPDVWPQPECVGHAVGRDRPGLGEVALDLRIVGRREFQKCRIMRNDRMDERE